MTGFGKQSCVVLLAALMTAGLGACRQEEQNRPTSYEKGVYSGPKGTSLTQEQKRQIRNRHRNQAGGGI